MFFSLSSYCFFKPSASSLSFAAVSSSSLILACLFASISLTGLKIALDNIDAVIKIIKESKSDVIAKQQLSEKFNLDDVQTEAILEMRLRKLTGLEKEKILEELAELLKTIEELRAILSSEERILGVIKTELLEIKEKYAEPRKTIIDTTAIEFLT